MPNSASLIAGTTDDLRTEVPALSELRPPSSVKGSCTGERYSTSELRWEATRTFVTRRDFGTSAEQGKCNRVNWVGIC